jgi:hypothetical protein
MQSHSTTLLKSAHHKDHLNSPQHQGKPGCLSEHIRLTCEGDSCTLEKAEAF